jgi:cyanophycinase-like exopeptidase
VLALTLRAASQKLETKTNELLVPNNIATLGNILSLSARVRIGIALDEETATIITNMAIQQVVTERGIRLLVAKKATAWAHPHLSDPNEPQVPLHARILRNAADNNFVVVVDTTASLIDLLSGCGVSK